MYARLQRNGAQNGADDPYNSYTLRIQRKWTIHLVSRRVCWSQNEKKKLCKQSNNIGDKDYCAYFMIGNKI